MTKLTIITTNKAPHHKANLSIEVEKTLAEKMLSRGWATLEKVEVVTVTEDKPKTKKAK
jgi:hypothetical protein